MFTSRGILIVLIIECCLAGMVCAQTNNQVDYEKAKDVLDKMLASPNKMRNLQFEYERITWRILDIADTKDIRNAKDETYYVKYRMVFDCNGLGKKECYEYGIIDSTNKKVPVKIPLNNRAWDGHTGVEYIRSGESPGGATLNSSPPHSLFNDSNPWKYFTVTFVKYLAQAIDEQKKPVGVKILPDGKYQVSYYCSPGDADFVGIIDPEKSYSCIQTKTFIDGIERCHDKAEYEEFADGVWFPVMGERVSLTNDGIVTRKSSIKVINIKVNDPNFSEDLFHIDIPKGTRVTDKVLGIKYVVGDSMSMRSYPDGQSPDQIARTTLKEMAEEAESKVIKNVELFIPNVGIALEKGEAFILGLADSKLVNPQNKPESEESNKFLTELGKGDIAWDGSVIATRGAKVLTIKQESKHPMKLTKGKWTGSYKLPEKVELPYSMLVVTDEGVNYLMVIRKIESGGITVSYRQLNPDESSRYKQESEDS